MKNYDVRTACQENKSLFNQKKRQAANQTGLPTGDFLQMKILACDGAPGHYNQIEHRAISTGYSNIVHVQYPARFHRDRHSLAHALHYHIADNAQLQRFAETFQPIQIHDINQHQDASSIHFCNIASRIFSLLLPGSSSKPGRAMIHSCRSVKRTVNGSVSGRLS